MRNTDNIWHVELKIIVDGFVYKGGTDFNNEYDACKFLETLEDRFYFLVDTYNWDCMEEREDGEPDFKLYNFLIVGSHYRQNEYSVEGWVEFDDMRIKLDNRG